MGVYSDFNQYTPTVKPLLEDVESVYQAINNILSTKVGERLFRPDFGNTISDLLFEVMDDLTAFQVLHFITTSLSRWEPRVRVDYGQSWVKTDPDNHRYDLRLVFQIIGVHHQGQSFEFLGELTS